ncbi:cation diffusion facilitator family transporter [Sphingomonas glaciei]|uniref:Cation diffusion facilitator family transporter n=1 Tax=Sphingomonas glaciei TaxID=2938948 RepID=A0ABY5MT71_9SPHN|nr:cation diffusion facilitator family transporter [Sphingomonas glaciei]UUR07705.1 cation diffusion facilitator family transporter [Sphingomonas glaciei]
MRVVGPERSRLTQRAALASVAMALILLLAKGWAAIETDSTAMLGSLADTALDLVASLFTLAGVRIAALPADHDHRFGHGKAEALVALGQVVLIAASALGIGWRAIDRLLNGAPTANAELGIGVSIAAIFGTLLLLAYQRRVIAKTGSLAIQTDNIHYKSDIFLNLAVIAALVVDQLLHVRGADGVFGIVLAVWLLWGAWKAAGDSVNQLMDAEWPADKRTAFLEACHDYPELNGMHDVRTRSSGAHDFIQFHVWVPEEWTVKEAHDRMDAVEEDLQRRFPGTEIFLHLDPEGHTDREGMLPHELTESR